MSVRTATLTGAGTMPAVTPRRSRQGFLWQLQRRPLGMLAFIIVLGVILVAVLADLISPQDPYRIFTGQTRAAPGVGRLLLQAVQSRDFPVAQAVILLVASFYVLVNLAVDLLYGVLDPRIRYS